MAKLAGTLDESGMLAGLGPAIVAVRKERGMSQEGLAQAAGIERAHMGKIERGKRNITLLSFLKIATALHVQPSELLRSAGF